MASFKSFGLWTLGVLAICFPSVVRQLPFGYVIAGWVLGGLILWAIAFLQRTRLAWLAATAGFWISAIFYGLILNMVVNQGSGQDAVQLFGFVVSVFAALAGLLTLIVGLLVTYAKPSDSKMQSNP